MKKLIPGGISLELRVRVPELVAANASSAAGAPSTDHIVEALRALPGVEKVDEVKAEAPVAATAAPAGPWGGGAWGGMPPQEQAEDGTALFRVYAQDAGALVVPATQAILAAGAELRDLHVKRPSLEDVFIYLTGRQLR
jgi:ABC-2 type transport system ATP-binding protein